ncbi:MAG: hypothetical protein FJZ60_04065 [Chlamydiae bacterium]|nr:hypothetical protein [Chlamydiota bacterium]
MHTPLNASTNYGTRFDIDFLKGKKYDLIEDVSASKRLVTLFRLKTNVGRAKKLSGLIGLAGASFMALKIAMVAGASLSLSFPPLMIGIALLATTVALGIILYRLSLPKSVEEFQKAAKKFAKENTPPEHLLPQVFTVEGARKGKSAKKAYAIEGIAHGGFNNLTLMQTINPSRFWKKTELKMLRETKRHIQSGSTQDQRTIEMNACCHQISLPKTFLNERQEKTPLANGGDLVRFQSTLTPQEKVATAVEILKKMVAFWSLGYVHRDLKPENFLVHEGKPYLADYDTAQIYEKPKTTQPINNVGTPEFILRTGKGVDPRHADFYALGLTIVDLIDPEFLARTDLGDCKTRGAPGFLFEDVKKAFKLWIRSYQSHILKEIMTKLVTEPQNLDLAKLDGYLQEIERRT